MRNLTSNENKLYEFLKTLDTEISKDELCEKIGWTEQEFLDVAVPLSKDMKEHNARHVMGIASILAFKDENRRIEYFSAPLIDCSLLLEKYLIELNRRELYKDKMYQKYLARWEKYRELKI